VINVTGAGEHGARNARRVRQQSRIGILPVEGVAALKKYRLEAYATLSGSHVRWVRQQSSIGILPVGRVAWSHRWMRETYAGPA
jgi:hypothetical protein